MNDTSTQGNADWPLDTGTRLAFERTYLSYERTQMSWVRTSLALISFGFAIAKFFEWLRERQGERGTLMGPRTVGILMIAIGLVSLVFGIVQQRQPIKRLRDRSPGLPQVSVAGITATLIGLLGILALLGAILR